MTELHFQRVQKEIRFFEAQSSGQIHLVLTRHPWKRNLDRLMPRLFQDLRVHQTTQRNGVLLFLNLRRGSCGILPDKGIAETMGDAYWKELIQALTDDLKWTHPENALILAIRTLGVSLIENYPLNTEDRV